MFPTVKHRETGDFMKKKKLTFNSLALGNLKHRKKRYTLMVLGIVLSMVFSSSIIYFAYSVYSTSTEQQKSECGLYDQFGSGADEDAFAEAQLAGAVEDVAYGSTLGFVFTDENDRLSGTPIAKLSEQAKEKVYPVFVDGRYPEEKGEIAIEQTTLLQLGIAAKVGDTITLKFQNQNGFKLFPEVREKSFVLCGILKDKRANILWDIENKEYLPSAFVSEKETVDLGGKENRIAYFDMNKNANKMAEIGMDWTDLAANMVYVSGGIGDIISENSNSMAAVWVVVAILLLASLIGIVNTFTTNLKERKKQIGLYRAVGATKRQIRKLFGREALILSLISTPLSLLISYGAVKLVLSRVFDNAYFKPNLWVLLACGVFGVACVMGAAFIPLLSASKISPMQSIRNIDATRKLKNKKVKTQKQFETSKLIAKRNLVISKGKLIVVSVFLVITIVFSSYAVSYLEYAKEDFISEDYDYDLSLTTWGNYYAVNYPKSNTGFTENHKQTILLNENIGGAYGYKTANVNILAEELSPYRAIASENFHGADENEIANLDGTNYKKVFGKGNRDYYDVKNAAGYSGEFVACEIVALDGELFEKEDLLKDLDIDMGKLNRGEQVIVKAPEKAYLTRVSSDYGQYLATYTQRSHIDNATEGTVEIIAEADRDFNVGDKLDLSVLYSEVSNPNYDLTGEGYVEKDGLKARNSTVEVAAVIDGVYQFDSASNISLITTVEGLEHIFPGAKYKRLFFELKGECDDEIDAQIGELGNSIVKLVDNSNFSSNYESRKETRETIRNVTLLIYALVILLFTICGSIINNTIASNIKEDKKKIGTLRAVGANKGVIAKIYVLQLLSMFKWGFGIGFGTFFLSYGILELTNDTLGLANVLVFNPWVIILFGIILFAICFLSVYTKIRKEIKNSIVENIREL